MKRGINISVHEGSVGYKKGTDVIQIVSGLNITLTPGTFVGMPGMNGAGKSTLLKSMAGLLPLLKGDIRIDGRSLSDISLQELSQLVAIVLTEKIEGFNLTCFDLAAAGQMPYTNSFNQLNHQSLKIVHEALAVCGLSAQKDKLLSELSDGMYQKTVIARALAQQTPVILMDEPSAFLDYGSKHELFLFLKRLAQDENKTILVSSHDLDLLVTYCNSLLLIHDGTAEHLSVAEAFQHKAFMNLGGNYLKKPGDIK